jgi:hypothetical protein
MELLNDYLQQASNIDAEEVAELAKNVSAVSSELGSLRSDFRREVAATVEQTSLVLQDAVKRIAATQATAKKAQREAKRNQEALAEVECKIDALVDKAFAAVQQQQQQQQQQHRGGDDTCSAFEAMIASKAGAFIFLCYRMTAYLII